MYLYTKWNDSERQRVKIQKRNAFLFFLLSASRLKDTSSGIYQLRYTLYTTCTMRRRTFHHYNHLKIVRDWIKTIWRAHVSWYNLYLIFFTMQETARIRIFLRLDAILLVWFYLTKICIFDAFLKNIKCYFFWMRNNQISHHCLQMLFIFSTYSLGVNEWLGFD